MNKIIAVFLVALCMTVCVTAYSDGVQADLQDNLIRLHIIADSDDDNDQAVKLKVRDAILKNVGDRLSKTDKNECRDEIINDLNEFEDIANDVLRENGFSYTAHAEYGKFEFPEKTYKSMVLPAGEYYGVRIVLGSGEGHNWWCVMYPPLCLNGEAVEQKNSEMLKNTLSDESYEIVVLSEENNKIPEFKFKVVELLSDLK